MKNNPNWTYSDHLKLKMKYATRKSDGVVMTEDKTVYSLAELQIIGGVENIDSKMHMVKKVFEGEVVG